MQDSLATGVAGLLLLAVAAAPRAAAQTGAVTGRVTDAATGAPLAGARIDVRGAMPDSTMRGRVVTLADGTYRVGTLPAGRYVVAATLLGYAPVLHADVLISPTDTAANILLALEPLGARLDPVVVSVSRRPERSSDAPATVSVVDARTVQERPTVTPVEHARDAPGVDIATTGIIQSHIVTRGFNGVFSGSLLVLTDHRFDMVPSLRVNTPWLIPTTSADIDRLEVVLGPAAALYGPNAAAGVLQIFTKSPFEWPGTTVSATALARSGNASGPAGGGEQLSLRHAGTFGDKLGYKITAQYLAGTDWRERDAVELEARDSAIAAGAAPGSVLTGRRDFAVSRWSTEGALEYRPDERTRLRLAMGRTHAGSAVELTGVGAAQVREWSLDYLQAQLQRGRLFAQAFANLNDAGGTYLLRTGAHIVDRSRMLVGQLQNASDIGMRETVTYGLDAQRTEPRTGGTIDGSNESDDTIDEIGGYLQSETHLSPRVDFLAAVRLDRSDRLSAPVLSPRAAIVFRASDDHTLRLTFNRAFETPTAQDLFSDFPVAIDPASLPFVVRSVGVPRAGFAFRRSCGGSAGGLCMQSPFASPGQPLAADATLAWQGAVTFAKNAGWGDLSGIPAPTAAQVATMLRVLDVSGSTPRFSSISPDEVQNIPALRPTVTSAAELGYKGTLGEDVRLALDVYYEWRRDFIGPPTVITPSAFLDAASLAVYLQQYMSPGQAQLIATRLGGVTGSAETPGIPLGTIAPTGSLGGSPDVLVSFRNFGALHRMGSDIGAQWTIREGLSLTGAYSWTNRTLWTRSELGGFSDLALNAPGNRASVSLQFRSAERGLSTYLRGRYTGGFPMISGVYAGTVAAYTLADAGAAYRVPRRPDLVLTLTVQNLLDDVHREFIGAPAIGRLAMLQLEYTLR
ncbi:MAG TPA: TonB-dependent receptor [Gemmatimonadaceae bacterium]|nr:TonB-dependent receptor [Gemmatimonadaceae bacterium]